MAPQGRPRERPGRRGKLADLIRAARAARGLTQVAAAEELGIDRVTLARWETGWNRPRGLAARYVEEWARKALGKDQS